jgi:hypothetical protein
MKTNYTAEIKGHPETSTTADYNVTGDETTTHRDLAERAAVSAAMIIAEPSAEGWWGGEGENEYIADTELGSKHHTIRADLKGKAWGEHWSGTVTLDGKRYTVNVW